MVRSIVIRIENQSSSGGWFLLSLSLGEQWRRMYGVEFRFGRSIALVGSVFSVGGVVSGAYICGPEPMIFNLICANVWHIVKGNLYCWGMKHDEFNGHSYMDPLRNKASRCVIFLHKQLKHHDRCCCRHERGESWNDIIKSIEVWNRRECIGASITYIGALLMTILLPIVLIPNQVTSPALATNSSILIQRHSSYPFIQNL